MKAGSPKPNALLALSPRARATLEKLAKRRDSVNIVRLAEAILRSEEARKELKI